MRNTKTKLLNCTFKRSFRKISVLDQLDNILVKIAHNNEADKRELEMAYYSIGENPDGGSRFLMMADRLDEFKRALQYLDEQKYIIQTRNISGNPEKSYTLTHKGMIFLSHGGFRGDYENNIEFKRRNKVFWDFGILFLILNFLITIFQIIFK